MVRRRMGQQGLEWKPGDVAPPHPIEMGCIHSDTTVEIIRLTSGIFYLHHS